MILTETNPEGKTIFRTAIYCGVALLFDTIHGGFYDYSLVGSGINTINWALLWVALILINVVLFLRMFLLDLRYVFSYWKEKRWDVFRVPVYTFLSLACFLVVIAPYLNQMIGMVLWKSQLSKYEKIVRSVKDRKHPIFGKGNPASAIERDGVQYVTIDVGGGGAFASFSIEYVYSPEDKEPPADLWGKRSRGNCHRKSNRWFSCIVD